MAFDKRFNLQADEALVRLVAHYAERDKVTKSQWVREAMKYAENAHWGGRLDEDSKDPCVFLLTTSWERSHYGSIANRAKLRGISAFSIIRRTLWTYIRKVERYVPPERTKLYRKTKEKKSE